MITPSYGLTATERVLPRLALDFTTASLDSRVAFTRALNTATVTNSSGYVVPINADLPRFDYNPITLTCNGLLIEEARTNNIFDSAFQSIASSSTNNNTWYDVQATLDTTINFAVGPNNAQNACLLATNTSTSSNGVFYKTGIATTGTYAFSVYAKPASTDTAMTIIISGDLATANYIRVPFTLSGNGSVGATTLVGTATAPTAASISQAANGYYRCVVVVTLTSPTNIYFGIYPGNRSAQTTASQTLVWGAQLETGAFATSYIPTTTTSLTRNADVATMTGTNFSDWYNAVEGTVCAESLLSYTIPAATFPTIFAISDSSVSSNRISMFQFASGGNRGRFQGVVSGSSQWDISSASSVVAVNSFGKFAGAYKSNNIGFACNSASVGSDAIANLPTVDRLIFGATATGTSAYNGIIRKFFYYPQRLTDAELQAFSK